MGTGKVLLYLGQVDGVDVAGRFVNQHVIAAAGRECVKRRRVALH